MAAGASRRFGRLKQTEPVGPGGASLLAYTVADALRGGFGRAVIVTRPELRSELADHLATVLGDPLPVAWAIQRTDDVPERHRPRARSRAKPWGTAHAVLAAAAFVDGPFGVANADDWYGPEALRALATSVSALSPEAQETASAAPDPPRAAPTALDALVVSYPLAATLSLHGGVSRAELVLRGARQVDPPTRGRVVRIVERTGIRRVAVGGEPPGGAEATAGGGILDDRREPLAPDLPVSMNLWGLPHEILSWLRRDFHRFLDDPDRHADDEFGLGPALDLYLARLHLRSLPAGRRWFGLTHPGDAEAARRRLEALHSDGTYPTPLARALD